MPVNSATLAIIKEHEGLRLHAYPDPAHGWAVPTIGYGHTSAAGAPKVYQGLSITAREAEEILRRDLVAVAGQVRGAVTVPLNENQFGALVSFTFNLGIGNLRKSTLLRKLNAGDYAGAASEFGRWINAGGKPMNGLIRRREDERKLFLAPAGAAVPPPPDYAPPKARPAAPPGLNWPGIIAIAVIAAAALAVFFILN